MKLTVLILFTSLIFGVSCSKKKVEVDLKYTPEEFAAILGTVAVSDDKAPENAIVYSDYSPGVNRVTSKALLYERLSFAILEFETEKQAREEAERLGQYYSRNYLFDKVDGEPLLEDLVIVKFHAINPKKRIQRKPINIPHEGHGAAGGGEHH